MIASHPSLFVLFLRAKSNEQVRKGGLPPPLI
jgi:hypothetical protein